MIWRILHPTERLRSQATKAAGRKDAEGIEEEEKEEEEAAEEDGEELISDIFYRSAHRSKPTDHLRIQSRRTTD